MLIHTILDIHSQAHKLSFAQLKASLANLTSMVQGDQFERPRLAISSLKLRDIQVMLKLSLSPNDLEFRNRTPVELSPIYGTCPLGNVQANVTHNWFDQAEWMDAFGKSVPNEALTRITLNNLLIFAHHFVTSQPGTTSSDMKMNDLNLNLNAEGLWRYGPAIYKGAKYDLVGRADYSLWYGNEEDVAVSVVIVETKGTLSVSTGVSQTFGYMGCVHRRRKDLQKKDSTVYGVVSDGVYWWFLKINNDSEVSRLYYTIKSYML